MSFGDWVGESQRRFRTQPTTTATLESAHEFVDGVLTRLRWLYISHVSPHYTTTLGGEKVRFFVDSKMDVKRARTAVNEEPVLEWLMKDVDNESEMWDVGAYHGTFSVIAAARGANVVAFEPFPDNMRRLERNAALNNATIQQYGIALSDEESTKAFDIGGPNSELRIDEDGDFEVGTIRGDDIGPRPDVIKIDVEGHEEAVLKGMADHLQFAQRAVVEVHDGVRPAEICQLLEKAGLSTMEIETPRSQTYIGGVRRGR